MTNPGTVEERAREVMGSAPCLKGTRVGRCDIAVALEGGQWRVHPECAVSALMAEGLLREESTSG